MSLLVKTFESIRDSDGNMVNGRNKLFVMSVGDDGRIEEYLVGKYIVPEDHGTLFIVEDFVADQVDKLAVVDGVLDVAEGKYLVYPEKSPIEEQEEELLRQLAELRAQREEPSE